MIAGETTRRALLAQATALRAQADVIEQLAGEIDLDDDAANDGARPPALLDRVGLARAIDKSPASVDRLCREGMPYLRVGDVKRFELENVLVWLRERSAP